MGTDEQDRSDQPGNGDQPDARAEFSFRSALNRLEDAQREGDEEAARQARRDLDSIDERRRALLDNRKAAYKRLGEEMDHARTAQFMTWSQVAQRAGITTETLRMIRQGGTEMRELTKRSLETALRWTPGSIDTVLSGGSPTTIKNRFRIQLLPNADITAGDDQLLALREELIQLQAHRDSAQRRAAIARDAAVHARQAAMQAQDALLAAERQMDEAEHDLAATRQRIHELERRQAGLSAEAQSVSLANLWTALQQTYTKGWGTEILDDSVREFIQKHKEGPDLLETMANFFVNHGGTDDDKAMGQMLQDVLARVSQ